MAKIYDIYEKDVTKYIEEFYPQILANSDNGGVHFSFISDRDAAGKSLFSTSITFSFLLTLSFEGLFLVTWHYLTDLREYSQKTFPNIRIKTWLGDGGFGLKRLLFDNVFNEHSEA